VQSSENPRRELRTRTARRLLFLAVLAGAAIPAADTSGQGLINRAARCQDLERQLVSDWQRGTSPQDSVTQIDQQLEQLQRQRRGAEAEANQRQCYEDMFLFGRSLKRNKPCIQLDAQIEDLRRQIGVLRQQRDALTNSAARRNRHDDLVAELARNGCGSQYAREYESRRRSTSLFSLWEDEDTSFDRRDANNSFNQSNLPFSSYRTMCVRLCDGYYFPISFSTLGSRFQDDDSKCKEQCAAPAELFVYKNPGEDVEQMVSLTGEPYKNLRNAFRSRKEYVKGCSCKAEEYSLQQIERSEQELRNKRADARGGKKAAADPSPAPAPASTPPASEDAQNSVGGIPKSAR
jgi:hypothetical protein